MMMKNISTRSRVFIGLCEIAGYNTALKKGFDAINVKSIFVDLNSHPFKYDTGTIDNIPLKLIKYLGQKRVATPANNYLNKIFWIFCQQIIKLPLFLWALINYDVFIFGFKSTFFNFYELPILKFLGKRIIYIFYGSDSRPPYINGFFFALPIQKSIRLSFLYKKQIKWIEHYADCIISHPPFSHFHEKKFVQFLKLGIPFTADKPRTALVKADNHKLITLHAPSNPERKGTEIIRQTIKKLQGKGYCIELHEIVGKPNAEVLTALSACDFVIDELYSDTLMARFAAEAAFFGKPAIVAGYTSYSNWGNILPEEMPPVHYCHPDKLEEAIEKLITEEVYRRDLGRRAKKFVDERWSVKAVAERYMRLIMNNYPEEWLYNPKNIEYAHGWGLSEQQVKSFIRKTIEKGGKKVLQLSDKPELEQKFIEFAYS